MSINSVVNSTYSSSLWGLDINLAEKDAAGASSASKSSSSSTSAKASSYGSGSSAIHALSSVLSSIMDDMGLASGDKVSFQTLLSYRDKLQEEFTAGIRKGLQEAGVADDANFRLVSGPNGSGIQVITDHPDKALIEKYIKDHPELVRQFEKLQSLHKLDEARQSRQIDIKAIRERIQMESMSAWWSADTSSFMAFTPQGAAFYSGINAIA
jgi:hypothetical protein